MTINGTDFAINTAPTPSPRSQLHAQPAHHPGHQHANSHMSGGVDTTLTGANQDQHRACGLITPRLGRSHSSAPPRQHWRSAGRLGRSGDEHVGSIYRESPAAFWQASVHGTWSCCRTTTGRVTCRSTPWLPTWHWHHGADQERAAGKLLLTAGNTYTSNTLSA